MKKIILYAIVFFAITISACNKEDANKDVNASIKKLELFNDTFAEFYADGKISTEIAEGEKKSEFDQLKQIGSEYYDLINKINNQVRKEKEAIEEGDNSGKYQDQYSKTLEDNTAEINKAKELFEKNMEIISASK